MPPKGSMEMKHLKRVTRNGVVYLYFNTGEKIDNRPQYTSLDKQGDIEVGARYTAALQARRRRVGIPTSMTVRQLAQRYQRSPEFCKKADNTQRTYSMYIERLAKEFDAHGAGELDSSEILELCDEMGARPAAVDMLLVSCKQMYAWAFKRKYVHHNPFEHVEREDWEARAYEPWPEDALAEALADPKMSLAVALMYFTGQRINDCLKMKWDDIEGDEIEVVQQKTKTHLFIPIHSQLREVLGAASRLGPTILADEKGRKRKDQTVRYWVREFGNKRGLKLVPHGLRKNAVNALLEAECSVGEVTSITGQSLRIVEHYAAKRNSRRMGRSAVNKWERSGNKENSGKTRQETVDSQ